MISRSPRCTTGSADGRPGLRRIRIDGRRRLMADAPAAARRRRADADAADAAERLAQRAVVARPPAAARRARGPSIAIARRVVALGRDEQRHRRPVSRCSSTTATAAGSWPSGGSVRMRDAAEFVHRHADVHPHAAHRAAQHDALAIDFDLPHSARPRRRRARHSARAGRGVEPQRAARPGGLPPTPILTPRNCSQPGFCRPVDGRNHAAAPSESA